MITDDKKTDKNVLVVQYSQSRQLYNVVNQFTKALHDCNSIQMHTLTLEAKHDYPFPWPFLDFFDIFPECVYLDAPANKPIPAEILTVRYDLVILAYQVWFLSPSLPVTAFLLSPEAKQLLNNTPVITLITCRNMWTQAQSSVQSLLRNTGASHIDNVVLTDRASIMSSFITTPRWMLTGRKDSIFGLPAAGIADAHIRACTRFGDALVTALLNNKHRANKPLLNGLGAVKADARLIRLEKLGKRSFLIWGGLIRRLGKPKSKSRIPVLLIYIIFLVCMILTVVPMVLLLSQLIKPLLKQFDRALEKQHEQPSGSSQRRLETL